MHTMCLNSIEILIVLFYFLFTVGFGAEDEDFDAPYSPTSAVFNYYEPMDLDLLDEPPSPEPFENFNFLFDDNEMPDVDTLAHYIFSTLTDAEIAQVNAIGDILEDYFGEI